jgi:hypothetical protein
MDKPIQNPDRTPLADRLREDAKHLSLSHTESTNSLQDRTLHAIREEFHGSNGIPGVPKVTNLWPLAAAASLALVAALSLPRKDPVVPPAEKAPAHPTQHEIQAIAELSSPGFSLESMEPYLANPLSSEFNAMVEELEATVQGLIELVEPS